MSQFMGLEMTFGNKLILADVASKRPFSCMGSHMRFKVACFRKFFKTTFIRTE
jgi:hypothetical protein